VRIRTHDPDGAEPSVLQWLIGILGETRNRNPHRCDHPNGAKIWHDNPEINESSETLALIK
jgi:hypothetical protein